MRNLSQVALDRKGFLSGYMPLSQAIEWTTLMPPSCRTPLRQTTLHRHGARELKDDLAVGLRRYLSLYRFLISRFSTLPAPLLGRSSTVMYSFGTLKAAIRVLR